MAQKTPAENMDLSPFAAQARYDLEIAEAKLTNRINREVKARRADANYSGEQLTAYDIVMPAACAGRSNRL